jgi:hypothetical protein
LAFLWVPDFDLISVLHRTASLEWRLQG